MDGGAEGGSTDGEEFGARAAELFTRDGGTEEESWEHGVGGCGGWWERGGSCGARVCEEECVAYSPWSVVCLCAYGEAVE